MVAPLFAVRALAWTPPDPAGFDAVMLTSASAARQASDGLAAVHATCPAMRSARRPRPPPRKRASPTSGSGPDDGAALLLMMAEDGVRARLPSLRRRTISRSAMPDVAITRVPVYAAEARRPPAGAGGGHARPAPFAPRRRACSRDWRATGRRIRIAAISARTARAAGEGWQAVRPSPRPRDQALLELAAKLCQKAAR